VKNRFRPRVEALEARECPSKTTTWTYTGGPQIHFDAGASLTGDCYWDHGTPAAGDTVIVPAGTGPVDFKHNTVFVGYDMTDFGSLYVNNGRNNNQLAGATTVSGALTIMGGSVLKLSTVGGTAGLVASGGFTLNNGWVMADGNAATFKSTAGGTFSGTDVFGVSQVVQLRHHLPGRGFGRHLDGGHRPVRRPGRRDGRPRRRAGGAQVAPLRRGTAPPATGSAPSRWATCPAAPTPSSTTPTGSSSPTARR
jgi:hypothetical protein